MLDWVPAIAVIAGTAVAVALARLLIKRRSTTDRADVRTFRLQAWTIGLVLLGLVLLVLALPNSVDSNVAVAVTGLLVTAVLAISGQSIIANGMSGVMLRIIRNFEPGDYIEVADKAGWVSEMGLFHTEIQTEARDLVTLPNALMMNEPVRVAQEDGTVISVQVSIGYDVSRHRLEKLFVEAADGIVLKPRDGKDEGPCRLTGAFVQVLDLGDYSVTYRVAGFLDDPARILAMRARLRAAILDRLSDEGIEIMSPMYVARRPVDGQSVVPPRSPRTLPADRGPTAEDLVRDKADQAEAKKELEAKIEDKKQELDAMRDHAAGSSDGELERIQRRINLAEQELERLEDEIDELESSNRSGR